MTTLPQNQAVRMPRPPVSMGPAAGGPAPGGLTGADVVRVLRGNLLLILVLVTVAAVAGYFINSMLAKRYTATGYAAVLPPSTPFAYGRSQYATPAFDLVIEQKTQTQRLRSEDLYKRVLTESAAVRETQWFKSFQDPSQARQDLLKNLSVVPIPDTRLVQVAMQYSKPEDAKVIVEEVIEEHLRQEISSATESVFRQKNQLEGLKARIDGDLRRAGQERADLQRQLSEMGVTPGTSINQLNYEVENASKSLIELDQSVAGISGQLESIKKSMEEGQDPPILVRQVEADPDVQNLTKTIRDLDLNLDSLKSGFGESSRVWKETVARRDSFQQRLNDLKKEQLGKLKVSSVETLNAELTSRKQQVAQTTDKLNALKARAAEVANQLAKFNALVGREETLRSQQKDLSDQIDSVGQGQAGGNGGISWAIKPIVPEIPSFPKLMTTMTMAITAGLAVALAIAFLRELLDTTIRTPRDVARVGGGLSVLAMIPHEDDDPQSAGARLALVIAEAPQSMTAEQLRQLRTRLQHSASLDTTRSILVTSPSPGEGKTTVAANLAAGLALVGRRILLVDANFRRPELHKLFGIENAVGFSNVLAKPGDLASAVKVTKIPNLSVLPTGPKPANATEQLESALLHDFIEKAMENYDHVIFDSGPMLFASETVAMAPRVDGVVTVVRARQSTRGVLGRVKDTLRQLKAENLGVVINGIRAYGGGYYGRNIRTYYEYSANGNG